MHNITHIFKINDNKYALDYRNMFFCILDDDTNNTLCNFLSGEKQTNKSDCNFFNKLNALSKSGYFLSKYADRPIPNFEYETLNISFAPVHDCNFACTYCYAQGGEGTLNYKIRFDESMIDRLLNYVYIDKYNHYRNYKFDFVSGGEPLLDFSILEYFLKKLRYMDDLHNKEAIVLIVTNGTLLTSENIQKLDQYDVFLGISIDGTESVHNKQRLYKNGGETYNDVTKGISLLRSSDASAKIKDAWAMAVITRDTGSLIDVMETCINLGFKRMQMQLLRVPRDHPLCLNRNDVIRLKNHYISLFAHIIEYAEKGDLSRLKMIANDNDSFGKFIGRLLLRKSIYYRCFAGKNKIAITAKGEIFPCDSFCGYTEFCMGSINSSTNNTAVAQSFREAHIQNRANCSKCWARQICGGDCYYNSYVINDNIYDPDPIICEMNLFFIERTVDMLIKLQLISPEYIVYLSKFL